MKINFSKRRVVSKLMAFFTFKKFLSILITAIMGILLRYCVINYLDIDVILEPINIISIAYFSLIVFIRQICEILLTETTLTMDNSTGEGNVGAQDNAGVQGNEVVQGNVVGENNVVAQPVVGNRLQVVDPLGQIARGYILNGQNQPALSNIGTALFQHRMQIGSTLTGNMFTPQQESFILQHLLHTNRAAYDRIMNVGGYGVNDVTPKWWNQSNSFDFRNNFR